jgi:hypothetical protein
VAINDLNQVAFHGQIEVDSDLGTKLLGAVFTQDGLVRKEGDILPDDTILGDISSSAGVAINLFGQVAFKGRAFIPGGPVKAVDAVFISDVGVVAKVGDTLLDGTTLGQISDIGGLSINFFGEVAFHGRTGGIKAVFTQDGLIAKEGDNLDDGTTLDVISDSAGVSINFFSEVAFHGRIGRSAAVFVGPAPEEVPAEGDETSSE